jgi:hypothetical protein
MMWFRSTSTCLDPNFICRSHLTQQRLNIIICSRENGSVRRHACAHDKILIAGMRARDFDCDATIVETPLLLTEVAIDEREHDAQRGEGVDHDDVQSFAIYLLF